MISVAYNEVSDEGLNWEDVKLKVKDELPIVITHSIKRSHINIDKLKDLV